MKIKVGPTVFFTVGSNRGGASKVFSQLRLTKGNSATVLNERVFRGALRKAERKLVEVPDTDKKDKSAA